MAVERMPITPGVLSWARKRAGYKLEELAAKPNLRKIAEWESGGPGPTYRQLEKIAKTLELPMAVFFFPEPPDLPPIDETFRTLGSAQFAEIPPPVRLLMFKARAFQSGLAELNLGRNPAASQIVREVVSRPERTFGVFGFSYSGRLERVARRAIRMGRRRHCVEGLAQRILSSWA